MISAEDETEYRVLHDSVRRGGDGGSGVVLVLWSVEEVLVPSSRKALRAP